MAYDEGVAERLRELFAGRDDVAEMKMFGGIAFMVSGNMCCGVIGDRLMARVGPIQYEEALAKPYAREMDFSGKPMKGFLFIEPEGFASDADLKEWVRLCEHFGGRLPTK